MELIREAVRQNAALYDVDKVYLFGSQATGKATETSDVDLYVYPGNARFLRVCAMESDIEEQIGKPVDMIVDGTMDLFFPLDMERDGILLYEKM